VHGRGQGAPPGILKFRYFAILYGRRLSRREATTQVLLVPTAVAVAFVLLAMVDAIERV